VKITKEQLKKLIIETIDEMRIDTVSGHAGDQGESIPKKQQSLADAFAEKYDHEIEISDDGEKVFYLFDDDLWAISAADVPSSWSRESTGSESYIYHTGEYIKRTPGVS
tara:strand:+ start:162 stop:488 length:327 start_codon:yes stop_codon:yes gene_type:complete